MNPENDTSEFLKQKQSYESSCGGKNTSLQKKRRRVLISAAALIAACVTVYFYNPENSRFPSCLSLTVFNIYCPACGMTRAAYHIMHFNFVQAFYYNQFLVVTLPFFAYIYIADSLNSYTGKKILPLFKFNKKTAFIITALFLLYGILRNTQAFSFLAPVKI